MVDEKAETAEIKVEKRSAFRLGQVESFPDLVEFSSKEEGEIEKLINYRRRYHELLATELKEKGVEVRMSKPLTGVEITESPMTKAVVARDIDNPDFSSQEHMDALYRELGILKEGETVIESVFTSGTLYPNELHDSLLPSTHEMGADVSKPIFWKDDKGLDKLAQISYNPDEFAVVFGTVTISETNKADITDGIQAADSSVVIIKKH